MPWRLAYSLDTLRSQVNDTYPDRSTVSDGLLGDATHRAEDSDHNPNAANVVCALDLTNDPGTFDAHAVADTIVSDPHPDLKYIISNRRIAEWQYDFRWRAYNGSDPHINHIHVSVGRGDDGHSVQPYDDTIKWNIGGNMPTTEEILRSALNKAEMDAKTFESAMNAAREADRIHESALNAANDKIKQLEAGITKQAVLDYVNKHLQ